jgi:glycosyltransferase involved in cell wall biosynthesis
MSKALDKAIQVYKNQGLKGVAKKSRSTLKYRTKNVKRRLSPYKETLEQKSLREEYDFVSNKLFQISSDDIELSKTVCDTPKPSEIRTATWFVPYYDHFGFNGIQTIFRFMEKLSKEGVKNHIVIYDNPTMDTMKMQREIAHHFPALKDYRITVFGDDKLQDINKLPASDIAFCTIWVSAYVLLRFNKTKRKYYFIQDYEPLFYVAGSTSALAESSYRFGFEGIVNTPGLLAAVNQAHGLEGVSFIPAVNHELYYPNPQRSNDNDKVRIFFYARPLNPRNAFNLGILTIEQLLNKYGHKIEIITAGAEWNENQYGLGGKITNMGLIKSLDEVAALYRSCDIGFAYMLNKHTTYQMMEYSASGMATVMNENEDHHWLHKDGENCLLAEPSPKSMAEKIGRLIDEPRLRKQLVERAQESLGYTWDQQTEMIWDHIKKS